MLPNSHTTNASLTRRWVKARAKKSRETWPSETSIHHHASESQEQRHIARRRVEKKNRGVGSSDHGDGLRDATEGGEAREGDDDRQMPLSRGPRLLVPSG